MVNKDNYQQIILILMNSLQKFCLYLDCLHIFQKNPSLCNLSHCYNYIHPFNLRNHEEQQSQPHHHSPQGQRSQVGRILVDHRISPQLRASHRETYLPPLKHHEILGNAALSHPQHHLLHLLHYLQKGTMRQLHVHLNTASQTSSSPHWSSYGRYPRRSQNLRRQDPENHTALWRYRQRQQRLPRQYGARIFAGHCTDTIILRSAQKFPQTQGKGTTYGPQGKERRDEARSGYL